MNEHELKAVASQLAKPTGETGIAVGEKMNQGNVVMIDASIAALATVAGERILEIGPGNGVLSIPIVRALGDSGSYIALEYSEDMAREANKNLSALLPNGVEIKTGDCLEADIPEESIDGLLATNVLYFIDDIDALFSKCIAWLKPKGRAVFAVRSSKTMKSLPFTEYGFNIRPVETLMESLSIAGFTNITAKYIIDDPSKFVDDTTDNDKPDDPSIGSIIITGLKS